MSSEARPLFAAFGWGQPVKAVVSKGALSPFMNGILVLLACCIPIATLAYLADVQPIVAIKTVEFTEPDIVFILLAAIVVIRVMWRGCHSVPRSFALPIICYFAATLLSASFAADKLRSFAGVVQMTEFVVLAWAISLLSSPKASLRVVHFMLLAFAFESLLAAWQFVSHDTSFRFPHGTFLNNEKFSEFCGVGAAMAYGLFIGSSKVRAKLAYLSLTFVLLLGAVLGQERHPWLAFLVSGAVVTFLSSQGKRRKKLMLQFVAVIISAVLVVASIPELREGVVSRIAESQLQDVGRNTLLSRLALWGLAWHLFTTHPLLGIGPKNFTDISASFLTLEETGYVENADPHNGFLGNLAEGGIIGFACYLFLCFSILLLAYPKLADPEWNHAKPFLLAYLGYHVFMFSMLLHYFVKGEGHIHFLMIGLLLGMIRGHQLEPIPA